MKTWLSVTLLLLLTGNVFAEAPATARLTESWTTEISSPECVAMTDAKGRSYRDEVLILRRLGSEVRVSLDVDKKRIRFADQGWGPIESQTVLDFETGELKIHDYESYLSGDADGWETVKCFGPFDRKPSWDEKKELADTCRDAAEDVLSEIKNNQDAWLLPAIDRATDFAPVVSKQFREEYDRLMRDTLACSARLFGAFSLFFSK